MPLPLLQPQLQLLSLPVLPIKHGFYDSAMLAILEIWILKILNLNISYIFHLIINYKNLNFKIFDGLKNYN